MKLDVRKQKGKEGEKGERGRGHFPSISVPFKCKYIYKKKHAMFFSATVEMVVTGIRHSQHKQTHTRV